MTLDPPSFHDLHTIRLRGPWQIEPLERFVALKDGSFSRSSSDLPPPSRATMPASWENSCGDRFRGRVRYHRVFHQPTGLEPHERVFLVVAPARTHASIALDGHILGAVTLGDPPARFDITPCLSDTMRLEIIVTHPLLDERGTPTDDISCTQSGGLIGEVCLEIED